VPPGAPTGIDLASFAEWADAVLPQFRAPFAAELIAGGQSNITAHMTDADGREFVVRRPPLHGVLPTAHDMGREHRIIHALGPTPVPVPEALALCAEPDVIGAPFYVMSYVAGIVLNDVSTVEAALDDTARAHAGTSLVDALVELHAVDWRAIGLEGFGKPTGYLDRQLRRFTGLWEHNRTREISAVEEVGGWLAANMPASGPATVVHGDYRLGNTVFAPSAPARLIAILDWEMATIGDPLADLGYTTIHWTQPGDAIGKFNLQAVTTLPGFPTRQELIDRYEQRSGRSMQALDWYVTLALWKAVVFMEGNYKRALAGSTDDPYLKTFGEGVMELAQRALAVTREGF
jgi:aminoglycoside phosphotransferase (APT) family kinase protein